MYQLISCISNIFNRKFRQVSQLSIFNFLFSF
nr:MAG TPA: hypothetical protein [Bacteriophage sp.]